jgi:hypothetical protein
VAVVILVSHVGVEHYVDEERLNLVVDGELREGVDVLGVLEDEAEGKDDTMGVGELAIGAKLVPSEELAELLADVPAGTIGGQIDAGEGRSRLLAKYGDAIEAGQHEL